MLLFILLQRSLFLLAFLAGVDVLSFDFQRLDYFTFVLATFFGLWYGIWLGLHWYTAVYEEMSVTGALSGLFRFFGRRSRPAFSQSRTSSWNLDDLVNMKSVQPNRSATGPSLEVFESETIAIGSGLPVHADSVHSQSALEIPKNKTSIRKTVKRPAKKI